jgi:alkylhydroperoxidase family enzyme
MGATDEQLAALATEDRSCFGAGERAALAFAEAMTPTGGQVPDEVYAELAASWDAAQVVEITAVVALFNYFNRFAEALHVPVTRAP